MEQSFRHEVKIGNATFFVNRFSRKGATETPDQLLMRVILKNAEREFKSVNPCISCKH